jgi:hypothetical protein
MGNGIRRLNLPQLFYLYQLRDGGVFFLAELPINSAVMKRIEELNAVLITNAELKAAIEAIGWRNFIAEIQKGFVQSSLGYSVTPPKVYITTAVSDMRCMPSYLPKYNPGTVG